MAKDKEAKANLKQLQTPSEKAKAEKIPTRVGISKGEKLKQYTRRVAEEVAVAEVAEMETEELVSLPMEQHPTEQVDKNLFKHK